jgi:hypothetical protein
MHMLYACRPGAASERIVLQVLRTLGWNYAPEDVRTAIDYMRSVGLAETRLNTVTGRHARLTRLGVAVIECKTLTASDSGPPRGRCASKR